MAPLASHAFVHQQQLSCPSIDGNLLLHDEKLEIAKVVVHAAEEAVQAQHRQVLLLEAARESQPSVRHAIYTKEPMQVFLWQQLFCAFPDIKQQGTVSGTFPSMAKWEEALWRGGRTCATARMVCTFTSLL